MMTTTTMKSLFVSYDGALDPLGGTQVVPYLLGLAQRGVSVTLISFEKPARWHQTRRRHEMLARLSRGGVTWRPLLYHRRPRVPATVFDLLRGVLAVRRAVAETGAHIVHCRGDVAMAMARWARPPEGSALLYDVRGLFSDERVEAGSWRAGSLLDRAVRWFEGHNLRRAQGIVVLTDPARRELHRRRPDLPLIRVIPTCADLSRFTPSENGHENASEDAPEYSLAYSGSLGTWYMAREMIALARHVRALVPGRVLFLTPHQEEARQAGADPGWADVMSVDHADVPGWLCKARAALVLVRPTPAKRASCPTKMAEALACGLPVLVNRGVGDLDRVVEEEGVGVVVDPVSEEGYRKAAQRLRLLLDDPGTAARCRRTAEKRYSLESAVAAYHELYQGLYQELVSKLSEQSDRPSERI